MKLNEIKNYSNNVYEGDIILENKEFISCADKSFQELLPKEYTPGCILNGEFSLVECRVKSYEGMPQKVIGEFGIYDTYQDSKDLSHFPREIGKDLKIYFMTLNSLKGIPPKVGGDIDIINPKHILTVKHLWGCEYHDLSFSLYSHHDDNLGVALKLLRDFHNAKNNNFVELIRRARELGVEEYFK